MISGALLQTKMPLADIEVAMRAIVGAAHTRPAEKKGALGACLIVEPATEQEIAEILRFTNSAGLAVIPRGGGSKLEWGNAPVRADIVLSMRRLDRVLEHSWADLTVTVQAGCTVANLQETLKQHRQRLAIDVLWPEQATVGGILSVNESGALRLRYGGLRDLIIGVTLALPDGTLASSGGKVVKNVAGYDLPKLATGALGTLGVITRAIFRLYPFPQNVKTLSVRSETVTAMQILVLTIQDSKLAPSALQVRVSSDLRAEVDILLEGTAEGIASQEARIRELAGTLSISEAAGPEWDYRQALWQSADLACIAKLAILPSAIEKTVALIQRLTAIHRATWSIVVQATGIGYLRVEASPENCRSILTELRTELERDGGSLAVLRQSPETHMEAWGDTGDALPLMRALKRQFDPKATLNPGRFVGDI
jgi:glycolate oxidase FAD binding subunit